MNNWSAKNPKKEGFYVVKTKTSMGRTNVLFSYWNGKNWNFTNQSFVEYLKEN